MQLCLLIIVIQRFLRSDTLPRSSELPRIPDQPQVLLSKILRVTGRIDTGRAVKDREYQLDETGLDKEQIVNLSITYCKTIVN
jgi:hypothetical protein